MTTLTSLAVHRCCTDLSWRPLHLAHLFDPAWLSLLQQNLPSTTVRNGRWTEMMASQAQYRCAYFGISLPPSRFRDWVRFRVHIFLQNESCPRWLIWSYLWARQTHMIRRLLFTPFIILKASRRTARFLQPQRSMSNFAAIADELKFDIVSKTHALENAAKRKEIERTFICM